MSGIVMGSLDPGQWVDAFLKVLGAAPWPDYIWFIAVGVAVVRLALVPLIRSLRK